VITETAERADATLRGSAEDLVFTDTFSSSEGINASDFDGHGATFQQQPGSHAGASIGEHDDAHIASANTKLRRRSGW